MDSEFDEKAVWDTLREMYRSLNHPRVGLSNFYIWRDDFEERLEANEQLDRIKDKLFKLLG
ncbi:MAG TPA: hypothetical protein VIG80_10845 [Bacillaceae bacterium]